MSAEEYLMLLKHTEEKAENTANTPSTEEQVYYANRDSYYGVNGSDFYDFDFNSLNIDDAKNLVDTLGEAAGNSDIVGYQLNKENQ